jgi:hypothetical protein
VIIGFATISFPFAPASARNVYESCATNLLTVGIAKEDTAIACSEALYPQDVGRCVVKISHESNITALDALAACRRVRRPTELASCVNEIRSEIKDSATVEVLDNCRRSLLPTRFSSCVVGISRRTALTATPVMNICISGSDTPRDFGPTFIPVGASVTPTSSEVPSSETAPAETPAVPK